MPNESGTQPQIDIRLLTGLEPRAWLAVGAGYSREDIKNLLLSRGQGFVGEAISSLQEIALKLIGSQLGNVRVLGPLSRQELLRTLLSVSAIQTRTPELKRLRRQSGFLKKLDRALQQGRMAFANEGESQVLNERLLERAVAGPVRSELEFFTVAYEAWMKGSACMDPPMVFRQAISLLQEGWPNGLRKPERIFVMQAQGSESLENLFIELLSREVEVTRIGPLANEPPAKSVSWDRWHTWDDAADALADSLMLKGGGWNTQAVLIPDSPVLRRSLLRAFAQKGIPLADPRDPKSAALDESKKLALTPLELVARRFERETVVGWISGASGPRQWVEQSRDPREQRKVFEEIQERGIRQGLDSYAGGRLSSLHTHLTALEKLFGGRRTCAELAHAHLSWLRSRVEPECFSWFERIWQGLCDDAILFQFSERRAPLLFWLERLSLRIEQTPPSADYTKPREGVRIFRHSQAIAHSLFLGAPELSGERLEKVWVLGLPPDWLEGDGSGDLWFSARDRELLYGDFSVRSKVQVREERRSILRDWASHTQELAFLDALYDFDGRERESLEAALGELGLMDGESALLRTDRGAHPRWLRSFGLPTRFQPQAVKLPESQGVLEISATALDQYSRCAFLGLTGGRWDLWDLREADAELWSHVRGNILHHAVQLLMESRAKNGDFSITVENALDQAWQKEKGRGLLRGGRLAFYAKARLIPFLEKFCEQERIYLSRSGVQVLAIEDPEKLVLEYPCAKVSGRADRIDEHPAGLFVMDYKSTTYSKLPTGTKILEEGYRLQLPFYALAARRRYSKEVVGVQYVSLGKEGERTRGIFFKEFNGDKPGCLTHTKAYKSLFKESPEAVWARLDETIQNHLREYSSGKFSPIPKQASECVGCSARDLCGERRRLGAGIKLSPEGEDA